MPSEHEWVDWSLDRHVEVLLPTPVAALRPLLGEGLQPVTVGAEQGLLSVAAVRFFPGGLGELPAFDELTLAVMIEDPAPDPRRPTQFNFATVRITSPNPRFLELAAEVDKMPTLSCPGLRFDWHEDERGVEVADADGPMLELHLDLQPSWIPFVFEVNSLQPVSGEWWLSAVRWQGSGHLQPSPKARCVLHRHPFFAGLPIDEINPRPNMALVAEPGVDKLFRFAPPRRWSPAGDASG